ncbi:hypothetical protein DFH08DRAFT_802064 [Mycena albidolilacea]|uniref:Uncharacterized protein n=1 Tax=Mycena albidolilacea TaxID=1033008 RepID=A0AAD7AGK8_9AGAR|nr:hypothetical protein DFH08DRAFT_802064 [Mycena albidolilacea]
MGGLAHVCLEYTMGWTIYDVRIGCLAHNVSKGLWGGPLDYETADQKGQPESWVVSPLKNPNRKANQKAGWKADWKTQLQNRTRKLGGKLTKKPTRKASQKAGRNANQKTHCKHQPEKPPGSCIKSQAESRVGSQLESWMESWHGTKPMGNFMGCQRKGASIWIDYAPDKSPGQGFSESPRNMQNGPEMGPKMLFLGWAGARGPGHKMGPWAIPGNFSGPPAVGGLSHIEAVWDSPDQFF